MPLVSIITPMYNAEKYIFEAIQSVLNQTYQNWEMIIVDDNSLDKSKTIVKEINDQRINFIELDNNCGAAKARNIAAVEANGKYIAFLDADDIWKPDKIECQVNLLDHYTEAVATYCDHNVIDENGEALTNTSALYGPRVSGNILRQLLQHIVIVSPSLVMLRRNTFMKIGGFDEQGPRIAEDYNLMLRVAYSGPVLYDVNTLASYRRHESNTFNGMSVESTLGKIKALKNIKKMASQNDIYNINKILREKLYDRYIELAWQYQNKKMLKDALLSYREAFKYKKSYQPLMGLAKVVYMAVIRF